VAADTYTVNFIVTDEHGATDSNVIPITVNPPHIQAFGQRVWCDGSAAVGGQLNATDQNGHPLTYTLAAPPENGGVVIEPNGAFVYTPNIWDGNDSFGFTASDGNVVSEEAFVNLYVFNRPPVANAGPDVNMYTGDTVRLFGSATDPDGEPIVVWSWRVESAPAGAVWFIAQEDFPAADFSTETPGQYLISLLVEDPSGGSAPDFVTINARDNLPPEAIPTADKMTVTVGEQVCFYGSQSYDPEGGPLIYYWNFGDESDPVASATVCHAFVAADTYTVNFIVTDEHGATDSNVIPITVNPPHIQAYGQNVWCDGSSAVGGQLHATDQNAHPLTYTLAAPPENGGVVIEPNGVFVYTPNSWDGNDRFWFTATDGNYVSNEAFVNLYVFNRPPVANAGGDRAMYTGDCLTLNGTAYDPDGEPIILWSWMVESAPAGAVWDLSHAETPTPTFCVQTPGQYLISLIVEDPSAGSVPDTITITVADNLPPESIPTATPSFGPAPLTVEFTAGASDPNEDLLTYAWNFGDPLSADNNSTLENPTHIYDQNGFYHVALDVCDGLATINRSITIRVGRYGIDYLLGDIDFDGDVDFADVLEFTSAYLSETGDPDYNSDADLDQNDGFIDLYDFALLANDWEKVLP